MSYEAKVFNVMVACPGDVEKERNLAYEVIYSWNELHSKTKNVVLLPMSWKTHSYASFGDHPQKILNGQLLKDSDLLIGIFWSKIGTKTGEYPSGSVEEIETHFKMEKPAAVFFSSRDLPQSHDKTQFESLMKFKGYCQGKSVYCSFSTTESFGVELDRLLTRYVDSHDYFKKKEQRNEVHAIAAPVAHWLGSLPIPTENKLSDEAKRYLMAAAESGTGKIMVFKSIKGTAISTGKVELLVITTNARAIADGKGYIAELESLGLVESNGKDFFHLTSDGFKVADLIREQQKKSPDIVRNHSDVECENKLKDAYIEWASQWNHQVMMLMDSMRFQRQSAKEFDEAESSRLREKIDSLSSEIDKGWVKIDRLQNQIYLHEEDIVWRNEFKNLLKQVSDKTAGVPPMPIINEVSQQEIGRMLDGYLMRLSDRFRAKKGG